MHYVSNVRVQLRWRYCPDSAARLHPKRRLAVERIIVFVLQSPAGRKILESNGHWIP